jgi:hypothetical protein
MAQVNDPALFAALKPLKNLSDVAALLTSKKIRFQQGGAAFDALQFDPRTVAEILKVSADDIFVLPAGNLLLINKIRETRIDATPADVATKHATQYISAQRTQEAVQRELGGALSQARARKDAVRYAKGYGPPPKPAAAKSPTAATSPAAGLPAVATPAPPATPAAK